MEIKNVGRPIGMCILIDGGIVVGDTKDGTVKMFDADGDFIKTVIPDRPFKRPTAMVSGFKVITHMMGILLLSRSLFQTADSPSETILGSNCLTNPESFYEGWLKDVSLNVLALQLMEKCVNLTSHQHEQQLTQSLYAG